MARPSLDEIFVETHSARRRPSLDEIFAETRGPNERPSLDEIFAESQQVKLPDWTVGKALRGGTGDVFSRNADVVSMNTAEIAHTRDNTVLEDIWSNPNLTTAEKAALMQNAQGRPEMLQGIMEDRAGAEAKLRSIAETIDPGEYRMPEGLGGRFAHDFLRSAPYTVGSMLQNAPLTMLGGPMGAVMGGVIGASGEAQMERADVYNELVKRGLSHEEAYRQSDPVNWQNMGALSASNIAQNILTFMGNKVMPGAGTTARVASSLAGDALLEGAEEGLQSIIGSKALGDDIDPGDVLYESAVGALSGLLFGGGGMAVNAAVNHRSNKANTSPEIWERRGELLKWGREQMKELAENPADEALGNIIRNAIRANDYSALNILKSSKELAADLPKAPVDAVQERGPNFAAMQEAMAQDDMAAAAMEEARETIAKRNAPIDPESTAIGESYEPDISIPLDQIQNTTPLVETSTSEGRPSLDDVFAETQADTAARPPLESILHESDTQALIDPGKARQTPEHVPLDASTIQTESGRSIEYAEPSELLLREDGSPALGSIDTDTANQAGIAAGEIHANVGLIRHVEREHGTQIRNAGYRDAQSLIADTLNSYTELREGTNGSVLLIKRQEGDRVKNPTIAIELIQEDGNYRVKTAWLARGPYLDKRKLLSAGSETPVTGPDSGLASLPAVPDSQGETRRWNASQESNVSGKNISPERTVVNDGNAEGVQNLPSEARKARFFEPETPSKAEGETRSDRPVAIAEIKNAVNKIVPWREGKTSPGSLGTYYVTPEVTRTKNRNDVAVAMHELGHHLDKKLGLRNIDTPGAEMELASNGQVASGPNYTAEQVRGEGVAQFFLHYAVDEQQAQQKFPEYYRAFEKALAAHPELQADVKRVQELVSSYSRQDSGERIRANTVRGTDKVMEPILDRVKRYGRKAYDLFVDAKAPLQRVSEQVREQMGAKYLPDDHNLYAAARTAEGYRGKADVDMAPFLNVVRGLNPDDHTVLSNYLAAGRAIDYRNNGMEPGLGTTAVEERSLFDSAPHRIREAAGQLHSIYNDAVQKTLVDTGIMSREQFDYLREKWPNYVPFFRVDTASQFEHDLRVFMRGKGKSLVNLADPVKKATGVGDASAVYPIRDPLESMLRNIEVFHGLAARNEVGKTMVNISKLEGMGRFAEQVDGLGEKGDKVFHVWRDGKKEFYSTDPDVYAALTAMNDVSPTGSGLKKLMKVFSMPAEVFKMGTTRYNPAFIVRNFLRDSANVAITSEAWTPPFYNTIRGLTILYSKNPKMQAVLRDAIDQGVMKAGITEIRANSPKALAKEIQKAFREGGITADVKNKLSTLKEWVGSKNEAIEVAPKIFEYYHLINKGMPKREAAMRAREVNLDFARAGTVGREINRATAFFNANVQGVDKAVRTFAERPYETMAKMALYVGVPSLVSWALGNLGDEKDRKDYEEFAKYSKDLFWHFKMGDIWMRIPKPDVFGQFGSLLERTLDAAYKKDPAAFDGFLDSIQEDALPPLVPTLLMPWAEVWANENAFTGRPIVSRKYEGLPAEMQYSAGTSGIAKQLGRMIGVSPMKIDHIIRGIGGTLGGEAVKFPDRFIDKNRPAEKWHEWPLIRSVFAHPNRGSESMERFYKLTERARHEKIRFESGRTAEPSKDAMFSNYFAKAQKTLSEMRKQRTAIQEYSDMTPDEKRRNLNEIDSQMIDFVREVLKEYDEYGK